MHRCKIEPIIPAAIISMFNVVMIGLCLNFGRNILVSTLAVMYLIGTSVALFLNRKDLKGRFKRWKNGILIRIVRLVLLVVIAYYSIMPFSYYIPARTSETELIDLSGTLVETFDIVIQYVPLPFQQAYSSSLTSLELLYELSESIDTMDKEKLLEIRERDQEFLKSCEMIKYNVTLLKTLMAVDFILYMFQRIWPDIVTLLRKWIRGDRRAATL